MKKHTTDLVKHIMSGLGMLIFVGMLTWCRLETQRIQNDVKDCKPCVCETAK